MKTIFCICILIVTGNAVWSQSSKASQGSDSCLDIICKKTDVVVYFKGLSYKKDTTLDRSFFKNGFEISHSTGKIRIIGFELDIDCPGCDIIAFEICGAKVDQQKAKKIFDLMSPGDTLVFNPIFIELGGKNYEAPIFSVLIK